MLFGFIYYILLYTFHKYSHYYYETISNLIAYYNIIGGEKMDYQNYDDYMRSVLGYSNMNCSNMCMNSQMPYQNMCQSDDDLERMYPDTYRVVHPMVVSACNMVNINMPITESMIDNMTNDIYDRAEADGRIKIDIDIEVQNRESEDSRQMRPRRRNRFFRDLIRILLLRELLRRRRRFPIRPF